MVVQRGEVWWSELDPPIGSTAGYSRPVIVIQSDALNRSQSRTTIIVPLASNLIYSKLGSNVLIPADQSRLDKDSVAVTTLIVAIDRDQLRRRISVLPQKLMDELDIALLTTLGLM